MGGCRDVNCRKGDYPLTSARSNLTRAQHEASVFPPWSLLIQRPVSLDRFRRHWMADLTELLREADSRRCQDFRKHRAGRQSVVYLEQHNSSSISVVRATTRVPLLQTAPVSQIRRALLNRSFPVETPIKPRPPRDFLLR